MLRARTSRREESFPGLVPEPILDRDDGIDPEHEVLLGDSVGLALLVCLETLAPAERVAFVLNDVFAVPFDEIAPMLIPHEKRSGSRRSRSVAVPVNSPPRRQTLPSRQGHLSRRLHRLP